MTNSVDAQDLLINKLLDNLPSGLTKARVKLPNSAFPGKPQIPSSVNEQNAINYCWLEVELKDNNTLSSEATGQLKRTFGDFVITIYWPKNTGNRQAKALAEQLRNLFANAWLNSLKLGQGTIIDTNSNSAYLLDIIFDYYYEGLT